jgi:tetratricopeptide (TPR) repeat protein
MRTSSLFAVVAVVVAPIVVVACGGEPKQIDAPHPAVSDTPEAAASNAPPPNPPEADEAYAALEKGDCRTARAKAESVVSKTPKQPMAHLVLGVCSDQEGKKDDAKQHLAITLEQDPANLAAASFLSAILLDEKDFEGAAKVAREGLKYSKGAWELHANLGYALAGSKDHVSAAKSFDNAIKLHKLELKSDDAGLHLERGRELLAAGDKDGAQKELHNAIELAGGDAKIVADASVLLAQAGDAVGCAAALDKVKDAPAELIRQRAVCKHMATDLAGARKDLDAAIAKGPATAQMHWAAANYAAEAKDAKSCKAHLAEMAKVAKSDQEKSEAKSAATTCK